MGNMGKQWKQCQTLFWGAPKSLQMMTAAMKLKDSVLTISKKAKQIEKSTHLFGEHKSSGLQPSRYQRLDSLKTIFPWTGKEGDGFGMIQAHHTFCARYLYYYISSNSDHQELDSKIWRLLHKSGAFASKTAGPKIGKTGR